MRKYKFIPVLLLAVLAMTLHSCKESKGDVSHEYDNWQARNDTYYSGIYSTAQANADGNWMILHNWSFNDSVQADKMGDIVVHVLAKGTGSGCPLYTDSVRVDYEGRLMPTDSFPERQNGLPGGKVFDSSWTGEYNMNTMSPAKFAVNGVIDGFTTALMGMRIGDRWTVYIPYTLGYGTSDNSTIPAYSTLVFDITLEAYYRAGVTVPDWKAKPSFGWTLE